MTTREKALAAVRAKFPEGYIHPSGMVVEYIEAAYEAGMAERESTIRGMQAQIEQMRIEAAKDDAEIERLRGEAKELRRQLTFQSENNHRRNVELDTLHFVWCDGGCASGVHRYDHGELTQEIVDAAIRNTTRLVTHWRNRQHRAEYDGGGLEKRAAYNSESEGATVAPTRERRLAPGWERLSKPGAAPAFAPLTDGWVCECEQEYPALFAHPRGLGACNKCAERVGVFAKKERT